MNDIIGNMSLGLIIDQLNEMNARAGYTDRCNRAHAVIQAANDQLQTINSRMPSLGPSERAPYLERETQLIDIIREAQNVLREPPPIPQNMYGKIYNRAFGFFRILMCTVFGFIGLIIFFSSIGAVATHGLAEMMPLFIFFGIVIAIGIWFFWYVKRIVRDASAPPIQPDRVEPRF